MRKPQSIVYETFIFTRMREHIQSFCLLVGISKENVRLRKHINATTNWDFLFHVIYKFCYQRINFFRFISIRIMSSFCNPVYYDS